MLKIVVDRDLCEANQACVGAAPAVFHVDDDDTLHVLVDAVDPALRDAVERAMRSCPKRALTLADT